uniref:Putative kunitz n=1 Tax=Ixodes ricinus TaxID=34613 RepID=A0A6B0U9S4_IXORI
MHFIFVVSFVILAYSVLDTRGWHPNCTYPEDDGPCRARIPSYFFDNETQLCKEFMYGGCEGNANNFETLELCKQTCEGNTRIIGRVFNHSNMHNLRQCFRNYGIFYT